MIYKITYNHKRRGYAGEHFVLCNSIQECIEKAEKILKSDYCKSYYVIKTIELITEKLD